MQEKSDQIWKYKRYALVIEYHNRPGLVAPFMIQTHVWLFMTFIYKTLYKKTEPQIRNELRKSHSFD